jgi:hypothetical protein
MPARAATYDLSLTTTRGCQETGDNPVYQLGELITVSFRVGSATKSSAKVTLFDVLSNGNVAAISFGQIATNQTRSFSASIGRPTGTERLVLQAEDGFGTRVRLSCTFVVASGPAGTATTTPTRTATPIASATRTVTPIGSATRTPGATLSGHIHTNRGCIETGDNPVFAVGDPITVSFRLNSATLSKAKASILDYASNVLIKIFSFGLIQTNVTYQLSGFVGPPTGTKTLRLRGEAPGVPDSFDDCSFNVVGGPPVFPTRTPKATRTATFTRTATSTRSPTPTKTPIPTGPCVGACTQPNLVSVGDLVTVTQIAAGTLPLSACPSADANGNGMVSLDEVMLAVNNAIHGC